MTYLITGATGAVGRHIVAELLGAGARVRALTRSPQKAALPAAVELVGGDLAARDPLPNELFDGIDRVFVFPAEAGVERFAGQAAAAGARRFVVLSSLAAAGEHERDHGSASNVHHLAVERAVLQTGVPTTILRPGTFANNLLFWAQPIRYQGGVQEPYPDSAQAPIHEADIAAVAALALLEDGHEGNAYPLTGPQTLTRAEQLNTIGRAIGRELTFTQTTPEAFAESMGRYVPQEIITMLLDYWSDTIDQPDVVRDTVENLTGRPGRTLAQWAHDHIADFTG
jgi:uncharacterized protein YbjT (DUF2867 family)